MLGAGLGAAAGGGPGAAIGAASGAVAGTALGAGYSGESNYGTQQRYNIAYAQCMAAKGNQVPRTQAAYGPSNPAPYYARRLLWRLSLWVLSRLLWLGLARYLDRLGRRLLLGRLARQLGRRLAWRLATLICGLSPVVPHAGGLMTELPLYSTAYNSRVSAQLALRKVTNGAHSEVLCWSNI